MPSLNASSQLAEIYDEICSHVPTLPLTHSPNDAWRDLDALLEELSDSDLIGAPVSDRSMAKAVRAGLLVRADLNDESHDVSQRIKTSTGSYWHGIMHRREPDYPNAKYWFHQVGGHPIYGTLQTIDGSGAWDPFAFVDLCERCEGGEDSLRDALLAAQEAEIRALIEFCAHGAQSE